MQFCPKFASFWRHFQKIFTCIKIENALLFLFELFLILVKRRIKMSIYSHFRIICRFWIVTTFHCHFDSENLAWVFKGFLFSSNFGNFAIWSFLSSHQIFGQKFDEIFLVIWWFGQNLVKSPNLAKKFLAICRKPNNVSL